MVQGMILVIVLGVFMVEAYLLFLNYKQKDLDLPENVVDIYDEERYQKWRNYSAENTKLSFVRRALNIVLILVFLFAGVFAWIESIVDGWAPNSILLQSLFFLGIYELFNYIVGLPFGYYQTFSIEERYGFNKTTTKTFVLDRIKSLLMTLFFGGALVALLYIIYKTFADNLLIFVLLAWAAIMLIMVVISYLYTAVFIKIFNKIEPLEEGETRDKILALADEIGFKVKAISKMDASKRSTKLNAFFSGYGKQKEIVLFDTLLEKMSDEEILSVLAHEFAHGKHKDVVRMFIEQAIQIGLFMGLFAVVLQTDAIYEAFGLPVGFFGFGLIIFMLLVRPIDFIFGIGTSYLSRKAEFKADHFSVTLLGKESMISALKLLARESLSDLNPHPWFVSVYYSHPPMALRIGAIEQL
jgi:STE24 endopeptidase